MALTPPSFLRRIRLLLLILSTVVLTNDVHICRGMSIEAPRRSNGKSALSSSSSSSSSSRPRVMFICKSNSCRSQMAHGFMESMAGDSLIVESSGCIEASTVNRNAATVMDEVDIDISCYTSNALTEYDPGNNYAAVISLCGCTSLIPSDWKTTLFEDWNLDDPPVSDPGDLSVYRRVRGEVLDRVESLMQELKVNDEYGAVSP